MPARRHRSRFRLAVADHAGDDQVRIVKGRAEGVRKRVAQFAAFVDRAGRFGRNMARDAAGERELGEQPLHPLLVGRDVRINLAVGPFEVSVRHQSRPSMARTGDVDHVEVVLFDQPVQVHVDEVQSRGRTPVAEKPRLDVILRERSFEQRIVVEIDLADRQVVGSSPIPVDQCLLLFGESVRRP